MAELNTSHLFATDVEGSTPAIPVPTLLPSYSSLSTSTVDTEITSPVVTEDQHITLVGSLESTSPASLLRHETSSSDDRSSVDSFPASDPRKGSKRTASGAVKVVDEDMQPPIAVKTRDHKASELSEQLKTRLKYAMLKVERGWQSQSLDQLEILSNSNPNSPITPHSRRRSLSTDMYITSPISQVSVPSKGFRALDFGMEDASPVFSSSRDTTRGKSALGPALRLSSVRKQQNRRSLNDYRKPPSLMRSSQSGATDLSGPKTPTNVNFASSQQVGFTPMLPNQAEMDAVDSLLFMSSPNNSNSMKKQSQGRPPVLDRQNSGKRVNFLLE